MNRFTQVDVFGSAPLTGNPLAVVHEADSLTADQMQEFAHWTGLSETTFLLSPTDPGADYRVRIFTPEIELPFAGHPTLGSAYAWLAAAGEPQQQGVVVQECGAGLVRVRHSVNGGAADELAFAAPPLTRYEPVEESLLDKIIEGLGLARTAVLDASWLVNGPQWIGLRLASAEQVLAVRADQAALAGLDLGLVGPHRPGGEVDFEVRALIPGGSVAEDPVTGSLNGGLARWLIDTGQAPRRYQAAQGQVVGAGGRISIEEDEDALWIGGRVDAVVSGEVSLPSRAPARRP